MQRGNGGRGAGRGRRLLWNLFGQTALNDGCHLRRGMACPASQSGQPPAEPHCHAEQASKLPSEPCGMTHESLWTSAAPCGPRLPLQRLHRQHPGGGQRQQGPDHVACNANAGGQMEAEAQESTDTGMQVALWSLLVPQHASRACQLDCSLTHRMPKRELTQPARGANCIVAGSSGRVGHQAQQQPCPAALACQATCVPRGKACLDRSRSASRQACTQPCPLTAVQLTLAQVRSRP